jgi:type I restriction enzyme S subunit
MRLEGWQLKQLDEIGAICSGSTPSTTNPSYWDGDIVWVTPNDLSKLNTAYLKTSNKKITQQGLKSCSAQMIPAGSIILSSRAPIGYVAIATIECCTNQGCKSFNLKQGYDSEFVYYNLNFNIGKIKNLGEGTTFAEISKTALAKVQIPFLENKAEQTQIAAILSTIDRAIEQTEAIIAKQQRIKTGLMQDLLTKGIDEDGYVRSEATHEFKDSPLGRIPVEWDVTPAQELCAAVIDCKNRTPPVESEGHPVIRTPNVRDGEFVFADLVYTDPYSYNIWVARGKPRPGDVVITREAPFGEACQIPDHIPAPCLGQRMMMYQTNPAKLRPDYLVYAIYSAAVQSRLLELAGGSTVGHIRVGDIRKLLVPHPFDVEEQSRIAAVLRGISTSLKKLSAQRHKLVSLKTGLMQDLLTGKVRVTDLLNHLPTTT